MRQLVHQPCGRRQEGSNCGVLNRSQWSGNYFRIRFKLQIHSSLIVGVRLSVRFSIYTSRKKNFTHSLIDVLTIRDNMIVKLSRMSMKSFFHVREYPIMLSLIVRTSIKEWVKFFFREVYIEKRTDSRTPTISELWTFWSSINDNWTVLQSIRW